MRLFKPLIIILFVFLIILLVISIVLFHRLSVIQYALSIGMNVTNFNGLVQTNFRLAYMLISVICGISFISLIYFILSEITKKLNIFSSINKSKDYSINNEYTTNRKNNKSDEDKDPQLQFNQEKTKEFINKINAILQKEDDNITIAKNILIAFADLFQIVQGEIYLIQNNKIKLLETYAYYVPEGKIIEFEIGDGLIGQVAKEKKLLCLDNIPDNYITVASGLGKATPSNLIIFPILFDQNLIGIIELASFQKFSKYDEAICMNASSVLGKYFTEHQNNE